MHKIEQNKNFSEMLKNIIDGIDYGFYSCKIDCERTKKNQVKVKFTAGKSHIFYLNDEDYKNNP